MTTAQQTTLRNHINANLNLNIGAAGTMSNALGNSNWDAIADYYNSVRTPQVDLWRPNVSPSELQNAIVMSAYVALTAVKQNGFMVYLQAPLLDATNQNIRDGFNTIFGAGATLTALTALAKKPATNFENLFTVSNVSSVFGVLVTGSDIKQIIIG